MIATRTRWIGFSGRAAFDKWNLSGLMEVYVQPVSIHISLEINMCITSV
jgi:hypothetical protein